MTEAAAWPSRQAFTVCPKAVTRSPVELEVDRNGGAAQLGMGRCRAVGIGKPLRRARYWPKAPGCAGCRSRSAASCDCRCRLRAARPSTRLPCPVRRCHTIWPHISWRRQKAKTAAVVQAYRVCSGRFQRRTPQDQACRAAGCREPLSNEPDPDTPGRHERHRLEEAAAVPRRASRAAASARPGRRPRPRCAR